MEKIKDLLPGLVTSLVSSFVVGAFSAYMTGTAIIARLETRLERAEQDVVTLNQKLEETQRASATSNERLIRVETKIDILLQAGGRP